MRTTGPPAFAGIVANSATKVENFFVVIKADVGRLTQGSLVGAAKGIVAP